jgi:Polysaccharide lyase
MVALASALASVSGACTDAPADLGSDPDFLWWTDHESGDLSDWTRGGPDHGSTYVVTGDVSVTTEQRRSGTHALRSTVAPAGAQAAAEVWLGGFATPAATYGAWFFLPAEATPATYWVFFSFHARPLGGADLPLWDLKLARGAAGLELALLDHGGAGDVTPAAHVPVPIGRWFQVEATFVPAGDASGRLQIWLDGALVFDIEGARTVAPGTAPSDVAWAVGSLTDGLAPAAVPLYVDDAYVSKRRLGPGFPAFWRN